jgi:hypothetical protein
MRRARSRHSFVFFVFLYLRHGHYLDAGSCYHAAVMDIRLLPYEKSSKNLGLELFLSEPEEYLAIIIDTKSQFILTKEFSDAVEQALTHTFIPVAGKRRF